VHIFIFFLTLKLISDILKLHEMSLERELNSLLKKKERKKVGLTKWRVRFFFQKQENCIWSSRLSSFSAEPK